MRDATPAWRVALATPPLAPLILAYRRGWLSGTVVRAAIVADATVAAADTAYLHQGYREARAKITDESALPIGFQQIKSPQDAANHAFGWLVTALATTMGAPFWFDMLQNVMKLNLRGTGAKPARSDA